ncbi:MAG: hypothetical protein QM487_15545 [Candidatus Marithrix sp.]
MSLYRWIALMGFSTILARVAKPSKQFVPGFKNIIEIKHSIPGRIRFVIPKLKNIGIAEVFLTEQLQKLEAIEDVKINTITGSLLIKFDPKLDPDILIVALLKLLDLEKHIKQNPTSLIGGELGKIGVALNRAVYEQSNGLLDAKTGLSLLLVTYGAYQLIRRSSAPGGLNFLWWAYTNL